VDALQWTFTMSASSKLVDSSDKLHIRALVGPMDVATVTWHRRLVRCANDDVDTSDSDGSLVLQGIVSTVNDDDDLFVLQIVCDLLNHISCIYMCVLHRLQVRQQLILQTSEIVMSCQKKGCLATPSSST
jgi:hypothetical protein